MATQTGFGVPNLAWPSPRIAAAADVPGPSRAARDEAKGTVPSFTGRRGVAWRSGGFLAGFGSKSNSEGMGEVKLGRKQAAWWRFRIKLRALCLRCRFGALRPCNATRVTSNTCAPLPSARSGSTPICGV